jgi:prolyl oligopeptidase
VNCQPDWLENAGGGPFAPLLEMSMPKPVPRPRPTRRAALQALAATAATPLLWPTLGQAKAARSAGSAPPVARVQPVRETFFGQTVVDPYRWMEDPKDKDWQPFMRGQDAHARQVLGGIAGRDALKQRIAALSGGTAVAYRVQSEGGRLFYEVRPAGADNFKLAVRQGQGGAERVLIDPTTMKGEGGVHVSLDWWRASPDGRHVVYGLSPAGSENSVLHVMEIDSGRVLNERIPGTQYAGPSWLPDSSGFFYGRVADPSRLGQLDYYLNGPTHLHRLNTDPKDDLLVMVRGKDPAVAVAENEFPYVLAGRSGEFAVLGIFGGVRRENPLYVARLADVVAGRAAWKPVCAVADEVVDFALDAKDLYLLTTKGADNGKVLRTPLAQASVRDATTVVAEGPRVIQSIAMARDGLYVLDLDGGYNSVRKLGRDDKLAEVPLPWEGSIESMSTSSDEDGVWIDGSGWLLPFTTFHHDPARGKTENAGIAPPSTLDLSGYEARRVFATARDGTRVPLSIVARKGLPRDGRNPTLVHAYGAYQVVSGPYFSPRILALLERGGIFATAHVRGGGEYGKRWWKGGQKLTKPNTWRDLIDCCEHLVRERWCSKATLTIQGGSAGGITMGMAMTERPDLFAGVISNVGVSNALRGEFSQNGPPNIDEFGTVKDKDGFAGLFAMDALQHVRDGTRYPAVLLTVGMTDPRVEAWHGAKLAARLQKASRSGAPVLLRVSFDAGHGLGSTRSQIDEERADEYAFTLWRAGRKSVA